MAYGIIISWSLLKEMMQHPLTDEWNKTFMDNWVAMHESGLLNDLPVTLGH